MREVQLRWMILEKKKNGKHKYRLDVRHAMSIVIQSFEDGRVFTARELASTLDSWIASARAASHAPSGILLYPAAGRRMQERVERELCQGADEQDLPLDDLLERTEHLQVYRRCLARESDPEHSRSV